MTEDLQNTSGLTDERKQDAERIYFEFRNVNKAFDDRPVLIDVSFKVKRGETCVIMGRSGVGKSVSLKHIMGFLKADSGRILIDGTDVTDFTETQFEVIRGKVTMVFQSGALFDSLTVAENLRLGYAGRRSREGLAEDRAWVEELFPVVKEFAQRSAGALSGGQQQQLAIARALVARPDVLLLDEPSLGLAPTIVERLFETLGVVRERGVSILLVEQRAQLTIAFADRTHVIANGKLRLTLGPHEAGDIERLTAAYLS